MTEQEKLDLIDALLIQVRQAQDFSRDHTNSGNTRMASYFNGKEMGLEYAISLIKKSA